MRVDKNVDVAEAASTVSFAQRAASLRQREQHWKKQAQHHREQLRYWQAFSNREQIDYYAGQARDCEEVALVVRKLAEELEALVQGEQENVAG